MSYCFKITILVEICIKIFTFIQKLKNRPAIGVPPPDPQMASANPNPPPLKNPGYAIAKYHSQRKKKELN